MPHVLASRAPAASAITRRMRLGASARDVVALLPPLIVAGALAVAWLLVRTAWGRDDVRDVDSAVALAIVGAVVPGWLARIAFSLLTSRATPGQRALGLHREIEGARVSRNAIVIVLWLALHPFGAVGWMWLASVFVLAGAFNVALVVAVIAAVVALAGVGSFAIILVAPDARAVHDRIAGTRLVHS